MIKMGVIIVPFLFGLTVSSSDYRSISNELLQFNTGDQRKALTVVLSQDTICERNMEDLLVQLSLHSGALPITLSHSPTTLVINDSLEMECSEFFQF